MLIVSVLAPFLQNILCDIDVFSEVVQRLAQSSDGEKVLGSILGLY